MIRCALRGYFYFTSPYQKQNYFHQWERKAKDKAMRKAHHLKNAKNYRLQKLPGPNQSTFLLPESKQRSFKRKKNHRFKRRCFCFFLKKRNQLIKQESGLKRKKQRKERKRKRKRNPRRRKRKKRKKKKKKNRWGKNLKRKKSRYKSSNEVIYFFSFLFPFCSSSLLRIQFIYIFRVLVLNFPCQ